MDDQHLYRIAIFQPDGGSLLIQRENMALDLPHLYLRSSARPARALQTMALERWNLKIFVIDFLQTEDALRDCAVCELHSPQINEDWISVGLDQFDSSVLTELERVTLERICTGSGIGQRGPLSRLGWIHEATEWIRNEVGASTWLTGEIEQHNASGFFALVRFAVTAEPDIWLKATGEPNVHERAVTEMLAGISGGSLPRLIASRQDWNAWIMEDAGHPFEPVQDRERWPVAAASMAELQIASVGHIDQLIGAHAIDQRLPTLRRHVSKVVDYLENAMSQQTSTRVAPIAPSRLRELGHILENACYAMEELGVPDAILHADMNISNILVRDRTCTFIDWSETAVGNPFITFEHMTMLAASGDNTQDVVACMMTAYGKYWLDWLEPTHVERACAISSLLAPLAYLFGRGDWLSSATREDSRRQACSRSVARYLDRVARSGSVLEICR